MSDFDVAGDRLVPVAEVAAVDDAVDPSVDHVLHDQAVGDVAVDDALVPPGDPVEAHVAGCVPQVLAAADTDRVAVARHAWELGRVSASRLGSMPSLSLILFSISSASAGLSHTKARAFSFPWPSWAPSYAYQAPDLLTTPCSTPMSMRS